MAAKLAALAKSWRWNFLSLKSWSQIFSRVFRKKLEQPDFLADISQICFPAVTALDLDTFVTSDIIGECLASSTRLFVSRANISNWPIWIWGEFPFERGFLSQPPAPPKLIHPYRSRNRSPQFLTTHLKIKFHGPITSITRNTLIIANLDNFVQFQIRKPFKFSLEILLLK